MKHTLLARDLAVLRHLAVNRVGIYPVLAPLFFGGSGTTCGLAAKRLSEEKDGHPPLIDLHRRALPGKHSYITLRPAACRLLGIPVRRAAPLSTTALDQAIALSYFCHRGEYSRHRLERKELARFLHDDAPPENVAHVATDELGWPAVLRVFFVTRTPEAEVRDLRRELRDSERRPLLGKWLATGDYGFAVLVPWVSKIGQFRAAIERSGLCDEIPIVVGSGPTAQTLATTLKHEG